MEIYPPASSSTKISSTRKFHLSHFVKQICFVILCHKILSTVHTIKVKVTVEMYLCLKQCNPHLFAYIAILMDSLP